MKLKLEDFTSAKNGEDIHKDGWAIRFYGFETCIYSEGERTTAFEMAISSSPRRPTTFTSFTPGRWHPPHESEIIPPPHWKLIKDRLRGYLDVSGKWGKFVIDDQ